MEPYYPAWQGIALFTADLFLVPLSRRLALTIQPRRRLPTDVGVVPDFPVPGSTKMARSINQETVRRARRYVYHHPDDSPLEGLFLPDPEPAQPPTSNSDDLIVEEGLFHGLTDEQLQGFARGPGQDKKKGMTINDLPWPIPGRKTPSRPPPA